MCPAPSLTWREALRNWGTRPSSALLAPAAQVAERGFAVDPTFQSQVAANAAAFGQFSSTSRLYLPGGQPPAVGSTQRNPDLAATYRLIARDGVDAFYTGRVGPGHRRHRAPTPARDPADRGVGLPDPARRYVPRRPGRLSRAHPRPDPDGLPGTTGLRHVHPVERGVAVGEALNILERFDLGGMTTTQALHHYLEASALAFADRNRYVGADTAPDVLRELLSDRFAAERGCLIDPTGALPKPVGPGTPTDRTAAAARAVPERRTTRGRAPPT